MTPSSREAMEEKAASFSWIGVINRLLTAPRAFKMGWQASADFYEGNIKSLESQRDDLARSYQDAVNELSRLQLKSAESPPSQESPEVLDLVEALEFYANDVFREADDYDEEYMSMEDIPETQFLYGRTARKALAAYYAKKGKG